VVDIDADDAALRYIEPAFSPDSLLMAGMIR
jgi:hypothetical protein